MKTFLPTTVVLTILCLAVSSGCRSEIADVDSTTAPGTALPALRIEDSLGREVEIPQPVRRIVSLAPACTEMLFAVGAGGQVVAVTTFDNYPPEVATREKIGGFSRETLSIESILALKPDVVFSSGSLQMEVVEDLEQLGLVVVAVEPDSLRGVLDAIRLTGKITGHAATAEHVVSEITRQVRDIEATIGELQENKRPRVYYEVWDKPLRTAGAKSFLGHMVELAGGRNIFDDLDTAYPLVSEEAVVQRNPEVILTSDHPGLAANSFTERSGWESVAAVQSGRIYLLNEDLLSRPGPRIGLALREIAESIYPERFSTAAAAE